MDTAAVVKDVRTFAAGEGGQLKHSGPDSAGMSKPIRKVSIRCKKRKTSN